MALSDIAVAMAAGTETIVRLSLDDPNVRKMWMRAGDLPDRRYDARRITPGCRLIVIDADGPFEVEVISGDGTLTRARLVVAQGGRVLGTTYEFNPLVIVLTMPDVPSPEELYRMELTKRTKESLRRAVTELELVVADDELQAWAEGTRDLFESISDAGFDGMVDIEAYARVQEAFRAAADSSSDEKLARILRHAARG